MQGPHRPGTVPALGPRAGTEASFMQPRTAYKKETSMMFTSSWFRPASKRPRPTTRLAVEQLEDRSVPSAASGSYLLVSSYKTDNVLRYDAATGAFVDEFIPHRDGRLNQPWGVVLGPND